MWWKFWTWFGPAETQAGVAKRHAGTPPARPSSRPTPAKESDILSSLSELIDSQPDFLAISDIPGVGKTTQSVEFAQQEAIKVQRDLAAKKADGGGPQKAIAADAAAPAKPVSEKKDSKPAEQNRTVKPVRDARAVPKPDEGRGDSTKTLIAEDGQWPISKGFAERFKDLKEADLDDDDDDGASPFQTMVPRDE